MPANFCGKNLEMMANVLFISVKEYNKKTCCQKKFSVFRYLPWETSEQTKTFVGKMIVFVTLKKNIFSIISRFFHKKLLIWSKYVFSNWNTF